VERLQEFLNSDRIRKMSRDDAQRATLQMLTEEKVDAADIIKDAIFRDQALDAFEDSHSRKRQRWRADQQQLLSDLSARMKQVEKEIACGRRALEGLAPTETAARTRHGLCRWIPDRPAL
jgi:hypothetical protein